jgi:hypothetical protein
MLQTRRRVCLRVSASTPVGGGVRVARDVVEMRGGVKQKQTWQPAVALSLWFNSSNNERYCSLLLITRPQQQPTPAAAPPAAA